jgi:hypothetical protein
VAEALRARGARVAHQLDERADARALREEAARSAFARALAVDARGARWWDAAGEAGRIGAKELERMIREGRVERLLPG